MTDVLVITGPVNASQLRIDDLSPGTRHIYVGSGGGTGSSDMYASVQGWLGGMSLRQRVTQVEPSLRRLGVVWFSAGHGGVQAMLRTSTPQDAEAWLCLDGLYTAWGHRAGWATELVQASIDATTTMIASASTSTPGQYADSRTAFQKIMKYLEISPSEHASDIAESLNLPKPDEAFQRGAFLLSTYADIGHAQQVPSCRKGFMTFWNAVRNAEAPPEPETSTPGQGAEDSGRVSPLWLAAGAAGGIGALLATRALWRRYD